MTAGVAAGGAQIAYYYIRETAYGVTPAVAPAFLPLRWTGATLQLQANTVSTSELRHDRHRATERRGQTAVAGDLTTELSYGSYDDLLAAAMCSTWAPIATTGAQSLSAAVGSFSRAAGSFVTDGFVIGDTVVSSGFATAGNNGRFKVTAITATLLTVTALDGQTMAADTAAAGCVILTEDASVVTGTARQSFSILKRNLDIGLDTIYTGCEVSQLKLACPLQAKVTATFSILGADEQVYIAPSGTTFGTPSTTDFMATFDGSFTIGGTAFHAGTDLNLDINNNMNAKYSLFQRNAYAIKLGMADVTGNLSAYVEDDTLKGYFRSEADEALSVTLTDKSALGNKYVITIPRGRFLTAQDNLNGDDLVIQQLNWRALLDSVTSTELKIQRVPA